MGEGPSVVSVAGVVWVQSLVWELLCAPDSEKRERESRQRIWPAEKQSQKDIKKLRQ